MFSINEMPNSQNPLDELEKRLFNAASEELHEKVRAEIRRSVHEELRRWKIFAATALGVTNLVLLAAFGVTLWQNTVTAARQTASEVARTAVVSETKMLQGLIDGAKSGIPQLTSTLISESGELQTEFRSLRSTFISVSNEVTLVASQFPDLQKNVYSLSNQIADLASRDIDQATSILQTLESYSNARAIVSAVTQSQWFPLELDKDVAKPYHTNYFAPSYSIIGESSVLLRGLLATKSAVQDGDTIVATLPPFVRPSKTVLLSGHSQDFGATSIYVYKNGEVRFRTPAKAKFHGWISLDGLGYQLGE